jgi:glutamine---fructose-6-phosphate transaminase (isomerizing)
MCGIFGLVRHSDNKTAKLFRDLFLLSESRGKEAAGFALKQPSCIRVFKTPFPASDLVRSEIYRSEVSLWNSSEFVGIGHSRLVTNGYEQFDINNQPVVKNGMVVIHNGIIVNENSLWKKYDSHTKVSELDSELIPTILKEEIDKGADLGKAIGILFKVISGMSNIAVLSENNNNLVLATNNGSIYYINSQKNELFVFASEKYILQQLIDKNKLDISCDQIQQLLPKNVACFNLNTFSFNLAAFGTSIENLELSSSVSVIELLEDRKKSKQAYINTSLEHTNTEVDNSFISTYNERKLRIDFLKRCTKCLLPETFPYIIYDKEGVCNYCNNYHKIDFKGEAALTRMADSFRRKDGKPECLVPFSGGRDSSYALHYVVKELGLKPIAFSYDWGMLTDLARRNQARMCGNLEVEHILVSADIRKKRDNIRKNVTAWLKRPDLGTIPLFMAGDKQYFYYANLLMKQNNLELSVLGENLLEITDFKSGFCGIKPNFGKGNTYSLSPAGKLKMIAYYGKQYLLNPAFINSSLFDTLDSFKSYYIIKHRNLNIYDYLKWDEKTIADVLINKYDWETDPGTRTTWRIGDGTAAFYNYLYYIVAGFTENDTFRSNQIREGDLKREDAIKMSLEENSPRWDSIQWYCRTIGIDFEQAIKTVNNIPPLYDNC